MGIEYGLNFSTLRCLGACSPQAHVRPSLQETATCVAGDILLAAGGYVLKGRPVAEQVGMEHVGGIGFGFACIGPVLSSGRSTTPAKTCVGSCTCSKSSPETTRFSRCSLIVDKLSRYTKHMPCTQRRVSSVPHHMQTLLTHCTHPLEVSRQSTCSTASHIWLLTHSFLCRLRHLHITRLSQ